MGENKKQREHTCGTVSAAVAYSFSAAKARAMSRGRRDRRMAPEMMPTTACRGTRARCRSEVVGSQSEETRGPSISPNTLRRNGCALPLYRTNETRASRTNSWPEQIRSTRWHGYSARGQRLSKTANTGMEGRTQYMGVNEGGRVREGEARYDSAPAAKVKMHTIAALTHIACTHDKERGWGEIEGRRARVAEGGGEGRRKRGEQGKRQASHTHTRSPSPSCVSTRACVGMARGQTRQHHTNTR